MDEKVQQEIVIPSGAERLPAETRPGSGERHKTAGNEPGTVPLTPASAGIESSPRQAPRAALAVAPRGIGSWARKRASGRRQAGTIWKAWWWTWRLPSGRGCGQSPRGRVTEILGHPDDFGVDVEVTIRKHHLPHRFPADALEQAEGCTPTITSAGAPRAARFPPPGVRHDRRRDGPRLRRRGVRGTAVERPLSAARAHRRREPLRTARNADRPRGAAPRDQRVLPRPGGAHAAAGI